MDDKLVQLKELGQLKEVGVLNDVEFEQQKVCILNGQQSHPTRGGYGGMNFLLGFVVTLVVTAITVVAMFAVRGCAFEGSYFIDGDWVLGVFGVLAMGFFVLLGFIIFLSFSSYDELRSGVESEVVVVVQQVQTAQFMFDASAELIGELICYARFVVGPEWDVLQEGIFGDQINLWGVEMFRTIVLIDFVSVTEQFVYDWWMSQIFDREQVRIFCIYGVEGIILFFLWLVLFLIFGVVFVYLLFFVDLVEGVVTQVMLMGSVIVMISLLLQLLMFFDYPHGDGVGWLQLIAMERTICLIEIQAEVVGIDVTPLCDEHGEEC